MLALVGEHIACLARSPEGERELAELLARERTPTPLTVTMATGAAVSELVLSAETSTSASWWTDRPEPRREPRFAPLPSPSQRSAWRALDRAAGRRRPGR